MVLGKFLSEDTERESVRIIMWTVVEIVAFAIGVGSGINAVFYVLPRGNKAHLIIAIAATVIFAVVGIAAHLLAALPATGSPVPAENEQRPWIGVVKLDTIPHTPAVGDMLQIEVTFRNTGTSPALNVTGHVVVDPVSAGQQPNFDYTGDPTFSVPLLHPGVENVAILNPIFRRSTNGPGPMIQPIFDALQSGAVRLYVHGHVEYKGKVPHWIDFSYVLRPPGFRFWDITPEHNASDEK